MSYLNENGLHDDADWRPRPVSMIEGGTSWRLPWLGYYFFSARDDTQACTLTSDHALKCSFSLPSFLSGSETDGITIMWR